MKALLLAGGYGARLRPLTDTIPKCLVEIKGKPLLAYWLDIVFEQLCCSEVIINTHYLANHVEAFVECSAYRDQITLVHEPELLGTLNTIRENYKLLQTNEILIAHADNFCITQWQVFMTTFRDRLENIHMTMMTFDTDSPHSCGMVELNCQGKISAYVEKPDFEYAGSRANGAVFLLDSQALHSIVDSPGVASDLCKDFLPYYLANINCFHNTDVHIDIGTPEKLAIANKKNINL